MDQPEGGIAQRVAESRKLAGLTQNQLAQRANVSASLVRKVEQGRAPASPAFGLRRGAGTQHRRRRPAGPAV